MDYRIKRGRWLQLVDEPTTYIALPFGVGLSPAKHEIRYQETAEGVTIGARAIGSKSRYSIIHPSYSVSIKHRFRNGKTYDLLISVASTDDEYLEFQTLIGATHYLSAPKNGMLIGCRFKNIKHENEYLATTKASRNAQKPGGLFACAVAQTMYHGNPIGRSMIAEKALGPDWRDLSRPRIVDQLGLAWGSRFAVDDPYIKNGIGTLLAEQIAVVAKKHRLPPASYVEVIRTVTKNRCEEILEGSEDWLTRAGYDVHQAPHYSLPVWERDPQSGNRIPPTAVKDRDVYRKLYYLKNVK